VRTMSSQPHDGSITWAVAVSDNNPSSWIDRCVGWCVSILFGTVVLYCALALLEAMLPTLIVILGAIGIVGFIVGGIVVFRTVRNRW
jgi:hypothetical protein